MKRHLMIHRGEKPFLCPYCPHRANQKGNLKYHILSVHQGLPGDAQYLATKEQPSDATNP
ncbi:Zinc finger protein 516 [Portunus trituberculatus]|uniref:Zinc finger protein 516 n=2 Tax=Portunus trituberculatus TaxID=210409 RepID=A0A5B7CPJ3_PORTR|nr:Zinc finger protein 516 [Portunus trituberculatus]